MSTDQTDHRADLNKEMAAEVEGLLGPGYVPDYYRSLASGFVGVAEDYAESALAARLAAVEALADRIDCKPMSVTTALGPSAAMAVADALRDALATGTDQ